jgi:DNA-binding MarR family transcriptional regulator
MDLIRAASQLSLTQGTSEHAVSMSQTLALHELDTEPPLSQRALAECLQLEKSTVSRMVGEMERRGLLVRERDSDNHRQYRLRLTEHGRAAHAGMRSNFHAQYERIVAAMTSAERAALLTGLPALVRAIRQHLH